MVAAPIFGYLGDRFNRKVILSCGIFFWSAVTFSSSFIPQQVRPVVSICLCGGFSLNPSQCLCSAELSAVCA
jgi:MFS family permease